MEKEIIPGDIWLLALVSKKPPPVLYCKKCYFYVEQKWCSVLMLCNYEIIPWSTINQDFTTWYCFCLIKKAACKAGHIRVSVNLVKINSIGLHSF